MGHRAYLIKTSEEQSDELFEANNSIPFFWLTLIDIQAVEKSELEMIKFWNLNDEQADAYAEQNAGSPTIKNSKAEFLRNAEEGRKFISQHFPKEINLYNDFIRYLDSTFDSNDILELSLIDLANFNSVYILIKNLKEDINAIKTGHLNQVSYLMDGDFFFRFTGYDRFLSDQFKNYSIAYRNACEKEDKERKIEIEKSVSRSKQKTKKRRRNGFLMVLIGLTFMISSIFLITKEGLIVKTFSLFIFCLGIIGIGYFKLK